MKSRVCAVFSPELGGFGLFFCKQMLGLNAAQIAEKFLAPAAPGESPISAPAACAPAAPGESPISAPAAPGENPISAPAAPRQSPISAPAVARSAARSAAPATRSEDAFWLDLAAGMAFANALLTLPNPAVGCCVVSKDGRLLAASAHRAKGGFHAERRALLLAERLHGAAALEGCCVYATLEPCSRAGATPPCTAIIRASRAARVVYGARDATQAGAAELAGAGIKASYLPHAPSAALARQFFAPHWAVFKLALRADGSVRGQISRAELMRYTHEIRAKITTLITFGATVRADLPTLDARFSLSKRASDVLIFSRLAEGKSPEAAREELIAESAAAPLWAVPGRCVRVAPYSAAAIAGAGVSLIEGGPRALKLAGAAADWLLLHFDAALRGQAVREISCAPARHFEALAPLAGRLRPLVLGRTREQQYYALYEIEK